VRSDPAAVHEDAPARAVRAGLSIIHDLEASGLELQVLIGIQTGEAVVRVGQDRTAEEGLATGDILNTAAALQNVARAGGIAVGDPTYRLAAAEFDWDDLGAVPLKGKAQPVQRWRPTGAPNTPTTASPMNFSTVPPFASIRWRASRW
jgi:adenylate cyclase